MHKKIIIFGGRGDLAIKKLYPALYLLNDKNVKIYAYSRSDISSILPETLRKSSFVYDDEFVNGIKCVQGSYSDLDSLKDLLDEETLIFLSIPPKVYSTVFKSIEKYNYKCIAVEKPHGNNLKEFEETFPKDHKKIMFIDHYLAKDTSICIERIKKDKAALFKLLDKEKVSSIEGYFNESIGAEKRESFDLTGIVRDVMQNHLIQMLAMVMGKEDKANLIGSLYPKPKKTLFGQYEGYVEEMGKDNETETAAAMILESTSKDWKSVPIFLTAGKGLSLKRSKIIFNIKPKFTNLLASFIEEEGEKVEFSKDKSKKQGQSMVVFSFSPKSEIFILIEGKEIYKKYEIVTSEELREMVEKKCGGCSHKDYTLIFKALLCGDNSLFSTYEEIYESWKLFTEIFNNEISTHYYKFGSIMIKQFEAFKDEFITNEE